MRFVPECEQMDEPFDPLDCLDPLPDAEVVVESLGPLLEGPIPPFDVVPDAELQGYPVHVQPPKAHAYHRAWSTMNSGFLLHDSRAIFVVSMVDDARRPVGFGGYDLPPSKVRGDASNLAVPLHLSLVEEDCRPLLPPGERSCGEG